MNNCRTVLMGYEYDIVKKKMVGKFCKSHCELGKQPCFNSFIEHSIL